MSLIRAPSLSHVFSPMHTCVKYLKGHPHPMDLGTLPLIESPGLAQDACLRPGEVCEQDERLLLFKSLLPPSA